MSKNYEEGLPGKIAIGSSGLGTISPETVEARALELAKSDGRLEINESDRANALDELRPNGEFIPAAPEVVEDPELENLTAWDEPLEARGGSVNEMASLDEANIAEQLVQEGLSEADHDQRVSASENDPPEDL